jgi:Tol biopolymer transport system component
VRPGSKRVLAFAWLALLAAACTCGRTASVTPGATSTASQGPSRPPISGWIAYQSKRGTREGIWLIQPDGSNLHEVITADSEPHLSPSWSNDGNQLVYERVGTTGSIWSWDMARDQAVAVTRCKAPCLSDEFPSLDPSGTRVAFVRTVGPLDANHQGADCGIWIANLRSGAEEQLTSIPKCVTTPTTPRWSPDGKHIVYSQEQWGMGDRSSALVKDSSVWIADVADGTQQQLIDWGRGAGDTDWSPDGKWIVFATYPVSEFKCCYISNLYRIHPDGKSLGQLTPYSSKGPRATQPRYSPDNKWILFTASTSTSRQIWIMPEGGGTPFPLTASGFDTRPDLQPTG